MSEAQVIEEVGEDGVARLTLNRPDVHNAFNDALISRLTECLRRLERDPKVRVVTLAGNGKSFSAGADLNWMQRTAGYSESENVRDAHALARLMETLNRLAKPTLALVHGSAFGGGVGLVACCDIAIAVEEAAFALSEVKLGLIPAVIAPYVIAAIGERAARRYFLTAERFSAEEARRLGLVHRVVAPDRLEDAAHRMLAALLQGGPVAHAEAKDLIFTIADRPRDTKLNEETAHRIARVRAGEEAKEGIAAFLEKRKPRWVKA